MQLLRYVMFHSSWQTSLHGCPSPSCQCLLRGLGAKEKKTGCGYAVVMATEARRFEPPHPATVRGERTASAYRNISNMHVGTRVRACAMITAVYIIPEQQLSVC